MCSYTVWQDALCKKEWGQRHEKSIQEAVTSVQGVVPKYLIGRVSKLLHMPQLLFFFYYV